LRKIRKDKGLSLHKLSEISGISKAYLIDMEKHPDKCNPSFNFIFRLEQSLNLEHGEIYSYFVYCRVQK
jgi:transcriptional regulator with XRE-family HTH domain